MQNSITFIPVRGYTGIENLIYRRRKNQRKKCIKPEENFKTPESLLKKYVIHCSRQNDSTL